MYGEELVTAVSIWTVGYVLGERESPSERHLPD